VLAVSDAGLRDHGAGPPGSLSVDSWLRIDNWAGINWTINPLRSAIALAVGLAGGLMVAVASWASKRTSTHATPQAAR
jgi:hypothetical protein